MILKQLHKTQQYLIIILKKIKDYGLLMVFNLSDCGFGDQTPTSNNYSTGLVTKPLLNHETGH